MTGAGRTVYIAGAGIAGLTLALALAKFGTSVVLLERNSGLQEFGAGLQISPNARRVLNQLGLDKQIAAASFEPEGLDLYPFRAEKPITTLMLGSAVRERYRVPYVVMHRADLAKMLFLACRRFANIEMLFGVRSFNAASQGRSVSVTVEEESGRTRNAKAFAFVGADGVNSPTRTRILQGPQADYQNRVAWRTLLDLDALGGAIALDRTSLLFGPGYHAVCYPLPHSGKLNIALFARQKPPAPQASPPKAPALPPSPLRSAAFDAIIERGRGHWGYWPLATVAAEDWYDGAVGLIGDAAHAMLPFQAQGAAMAIEDAAILAPLLMTEPTGESAFERFVTMRRARVEQVARLSASNGFAFHLEWPFTSARNAVLKLQGPLGHFKRLDWLYGFDAAPDIDMPARPRSPISPGTEKAHRP
ncbi:MAG TPA: FAD-dependent monooxygenase [Devosiaceae bacterium]|nr:FAD-dependent monooxygenase [Devosiaceae bacterium]